MFYASFVYFMHDGEIWSTANRNTASVLRYGAADAFTVYDNTLFYISDGVVYSRDLSDEEAKPVKLAIKRRRSARAVCQRGLAVLLFRRRNAHSLRFQRRRQ